ncbi:hypothetical protein [Nocardia farcinica]|uniref:hypothetical protein n=1 Tax=Nocardia farcinica TaxID=37329 RepID=UPI0018959EBE|nr:hypothetical protein [Nocardia farcinica]MBF6520556.1 hypothetical protein [Nocardia farcinica]
MNSPTDPEDCSSPSAESADTSATQPASPFVDFPLDAAAVLHKAAGRNTQRITVDLEPALHHGVRTAACMRGVRVARLVRAMVISDPAVRAHRAQFLARNHDPAAMTPEALDAMLGADFELVEPSEQPPVAADEERGKLTRLTVDLETALQHGVKVAAALRGHTITEFVRAWLWSDPLVVEHREQWLKVHRRDR